MPRYKPSTEAWFYVLRDRPFDILGAGWGAGILYGEKIFFPDTSEKTQIFFLIKTICLNAFFFKQTPPCNNVCFVPVCGRPPPEYHGRRSQRTLM